MHMTTRLEGAGTRFLPFNRGNEGGAGNPPYSPSPQPLSHQRRGANSPLVHREETDLAPLAPGGRGAGGEGVKYGHRTAYLWEQIWARDSWLEILGRYLVTQKDDKNQIKRIIFPRFHQLDATRKLLSAVLVEGQGGKYLIQHSAGSGKTNSIAWSAYFLADLHNANHEKLFDTVLVVSDRNVLDSQLQEAIFDFERTAGVVATIKGEGASKSGELAAALSSGKKIVVCTIQTFPFALKAVQELAATCGKRFAVIADEAHSSQTGEAAAKLAQKTCWPRKWKIALRNAALPTLLLPPPPKPKPLNCLGACPTLICRAVKIISPRRFMCIQCAKPLRKALSSMC